MGLSFQLPNKKLEADKLTLFDAGSSRELEVYNFPAGYARKYDGIDKSGGEQTGDLNNIFQDNKKTAENRMTALDAQHKIAAGPSDCCTLTAGYRFHLKTILIKNLTLNIYFYPLNTPLNKPLIIWSVTLFQMLTKMNLPAFRTVRVIRNFVLY